MKTVLITGASSGMGHATAKRLLKQGYTVYAAARRVERMGDLEAMGGVLLGLDISNEEQIVAAVQRIQQERGGVDILINNAGFGLYGAMEDIPLVDARYQFEVNLFGLARLTQLLLPTMRDRGAGRIVNISSMGGKIYTPLGSWYHATKHALEGWSDCLRLELAPFGIQVVVVEPGVIQTEFGEIVTGPLLKRSGDTPYQSMAHKVAEGTKRTYGERQGTPVERLAAKIAEAATTHQPKTRYVEGKMARPLMFMRQWLGDRLFDKVLMSQF